MQAAQEVTGRLLSIPNARRGCATGRMGEKGQVYRATKDSETGAWIKSRLHEHKVWRDDRFWASSPCFHLTTFSYPTIGCVNEGKLTMLFLPSSFGWCSERLNTVLRLRTQTLLLQGSHTSPVPGIRQQNKQPDFWRCCLPMVSGEILGSSQ